MLTARSIVPIFLVLCALFPVLGVGGKAQDYHPTTPGLTGAEASIDLTVPQAMERATNALRAAGLVPHKPLEHTIGGNNEWVMALIDCTPSGGKTRAVVSVASNPTKRGESYRVCIFLIEYMRTGKTPANGGLTGSVIGIWEWEWDGYTVSGKSKVTLQADGKATCPDPGWAPGEWWIETDGTVRVYWPTSFPKTNTHYVMIFTLAQDGRTMSTSTGNYYYKSVKATRVGDVPGGGGAATGGGGAGAGAGGTNTGNPGGGTGAAVPGFKLPEAAPGESVISLEPPKFPPGPMPLPPVGAQGGGVKTALLVYSRRPVSGASSRQSDVTLVSLKATHMENQYIPDGLLEVEVELSQPNTEYTVDLYVGGYLIMPKEGVDGVKNAGYRPAYEWVGLSWFNNKHPEQKGKIRRFLFQIPRVLPASIRAELYHTPLGKPRTFINLKETTFAMPWGDQACVVGAVIGDQDKGVVTNVAAMVTAGTTDMMITVPGEFRPADQPYINDFNVPIRFKEGATEHRDGTVRYLNRKVKWRETSVSVGPPFKDRDHRNNRFWPGLTNKGYVEGPPVWTEGSGRAG